MLPLLFPTNTNVTHTNRFPSKQSGIYLLSLTRFLSFHIFFWYFIEFGMHQYRGASIISHPDLELTLFIFTFARFQSSFLSTVSPCKLAKRWRYMPIKWGFQAQTLIGQSVFGSRCIWKVYFKRSWIWGVQCWKIPSGRVFDEVGKINLNFQRQRLSNYYWIFPTALFIISIGNELALLISGY